MIVGISPFQFEIKMKSLLYSSYLDPTSQEAGDKSNSAIILVSFCCSNGIYNCERSIEQLAWVMNIKFIFPLSFSYS